MALKHQMTPHQSINSILHQLYSMLHPWEGSVWLLANLANYDDKRSSVIIIISQIQFTWQKLETLTNGCLFLRKRHKQDYFYHSGVTLYACLVLGQSNKREGRIMKHNYKMYLEDVKETSTVFFSALFKLSFGIHKTNNLLNITETTEQWVYSCLSVLHNTKTTAATTTKDEKPGKTFWSLCSDHWRQTQSWWQTAPPLQQLQLWHMNSAPWRWSLLESAWQKKKETLMRRHTKRRRWERGQTCSPCQRKQQRCQAKDWPPGWPESVSSLGWSQ